MDPEIYCIARASLELIRCSAPLQTLGLSTEWSTALARKPKGYLNMVEPGYNVIRLNDTFGNH